MATCTFLIIVPILAYAIAELIAVRELNKKSSSFSLHDKAFSHGARVKKCHHNDRFAF